MPPICGEEYNMSSLTSQDGLFSDRVFKSFRDKNGYLWILGINGVARYDGKYITNYKPSNTISYHYIKGTRFYSIFQDKKDNIWVGGKGGLSRYEPSKDTFIPFPIGEKGLKDVRLIEHYRDSTIWVSCVKSENYLINIYTQEVNKQAEKYLFTSSLKDRNGNIWLSTKKGNILKNYEHTGLQFKSGINDICFTPSGNLYIATNSGVEVVKNILNQKDGFNGSKALVTPKLWLSNRNVHALEYFEGSVWAGTNNGLNRLVLDKAELPEYIEDYYSQPRNPFSLTNNLIHDITCDREGILWICTYGGLNKLDPSVQWFNSFRYDPEENNTLHDSYIFPIHGDKQGNIWMGSYTSGLSKYNTGEKKFKWFHKDNSRLASNHITQIYCDYQGSTWISTTDNVCIYSMGRMLPVKFTNTKSNLQNNVNSIIQHPEGDYWLGTKDKVFKIEKIDVDHYKVMREIELKGSGSIISLFVDHYNRIWVGTSKGLYLIENSGELKPIPYKKAQYPVFRSNIFQAIGADVDGNMWFGSEIGVYYLKNDSVFKNAPHKVKFKGFFEEDGLTSNYVSGILPGKNGEMWFSSWKGVMKYDPKGIGIGSFIPYSFKEGLVSEKYNRNGYYLDSISNTAYFGSANGVNYLSIDKEFKESDVFNVLIHNISVDGKDIEVIHDKENVFAEISTFGGIGQLQVLYSSSSLLSPPKQLFAWKLEGRDEDWTYTRNRELLFQELGVGDYSLVIRPVSPHAGLESSVYITIKIKSVVYRVLFGFLIVILIILLIYYLNRFKQLNEPQEKYIYSKLSSDKSSEIVERLNRIMKEQKPYLNPELTVNELAEMVGINSVKLSQVLNDFLQTRFYEYVNRFRVEEFVVCLEKEENQIMTLLGLSEKCGFSSKSSFYRFFKQEKGTTPAQFAKNLKKTVVFFCLNL